jgi:hypothetical protein
LAESIVPLFWFIQNFPNSSGLIRHISGGEAINGSGRAPLERKVWIVALRFMLDMIKGYFERKEGEEAQQQQEQQKITEITKAEQVDLSKFPKDELDKLVFESQRGFRE